MISSDNNIVSINGQLTVEEFHRLLAATHSLITKRGYQDIMLDFTNCTAAFPGPMLAICAQISKLRCDGIETRLTLPQNERLNRLFQNANWAHIIDPTSFEKSVFRGLRQVPTTQFANIDEQARAVNAILDIILSSLTGFSRSDLASIEWSLNELTDNVINHSNSPIGGFVQLSTFKRDRKRVEYVVCDAGDGIPSTLRQAKPEITSDSDALDQAIREGVTKNTKTNQGNGLFGAFQISRVSEGSIEIHSGHGSLLYNSKKGLCIKKESIPFNGTLIFGCIDYSNPGTLGKALSFGGKPHYPTDFIETKFENDEGERLIFVMRDETTSFGSRKAAEPINTKLKNLAQICGAYKIFVDFEDIAVISSSFADEVFGKLFAEMGPLAFMQKFEFLNTSDTVKSLIDRSILMRSRITT
jgi:anti-sigma regulatory factor (Ser/Thr protein kinase)